LAQQVDQLIIVAKWALSALATYCQRDDPRYAWSVSDSCLLFSSGLGRPDRTGVW